MAGLATPIRLGISWPLSQIATELGSVDRHPQRSLHEPISFVPFPWRPACCCFLQPVFQLHSKDNSRMAEDWNSPKISFLGVLHMPSFKKAHP